MSEEINTSSVECMNSAILSYRIPAEQYAKSFECTIDEGFLSEENLYAYDFVFAPYNTTDKPCLWLKYTNAIDDLSIEFDLPLIDNYCISENEYMEQGARIIMQLQKGELDKLVYSKVSKIESKSIDIVKNYRRLLQKYPNAFCYLIYVPGKMCWMGASPEILITRDSDNFATVALAGTKRKELNEKDVVWGQKEIDEHSYIEQYVDGVFQEKKIDFRKSKSYTSFAGAMCHIKSDYDFNLKVSSDDFIKELHPGPALTGFPKSKAINLIEECEKHDRRYYTGFLGPVGSSKVWSLYVNLRCMEISSDGYLIYTGGGYTKDSNTKDEWHETELKATTMKAIINDQNNRKD